jgi:RNA polymerase sporulation-specific sigma factor
MYSASPSRRESPSDRELVELVRGGDTDAFTVLLDRYMSAIRAEVFRYAQASGADGEDMQQEAMITLFRAVRGFHPDRGAQFNTYALTAIRNALGALAKRHRQNVSKDAGFDLAGIDPAKLISQTPGTPGERPVEDMYLDREASRIRALKIETLLSEFERRVLKLYLGGHSYQQISHVLGISTKAVDNALQRVRRKLRSDC